MAEGQRGKRSDPNYKQLSGLVPVELFRKFKAKCAEWGTDLSTAIEEAVNLWLQSKESNTIATVPHDPLTIASLIKNFGSVAELSKRSGLDKTVIQNYKDGAYVENRDLVQLCELFEHPDDGHLITSEELIDIRDRTFGKKKRGAKNGA
jgi:hypothetical protein